jgi:hypothetical protein
MMIDPTELRKQIQTKIDHYQAMVTTLQEKLALVGQVESLAKELGGPAPAAPTPLQEEPSGAFPPTEQTSAKDSVANGNKRLWELMQQGFQTYQAGRPERAIELFREARELNPGGFFKTWTTMISLPVNTNVARDKNFTESLFPK